MADFDAELRECVETILGVRPPLSDDDAFVVLKQWLAERNLGLVPIADADEFVWPGAWLARVRLDHSDHAVVMYGSPSGPMDDPHGALARGGTIEEGWLLARLDLRLPIEEPYGRNASTGSVAALLVAPEAEQPLVRVDAVSAVAGRGLVGDRYHDGRGTFTGPGRGYELLWSKRRRSMTPTSHGSRRDATSSREGSRSTHSSDAGSASARWSASGGGWPSLARTSRS